MKKYKGTILVALIIIILLCLLEIFQVGTPKEKEPEYTTITLEKEPDYIGSTYDSDKLAVVIDGEINIICADGSSEKIELDINVEEVYPFDDWMWIIDTDRNLYKLEINTDVYNISEIIQRDVSYLESNGIQSAVINSKGELYVWGDNEYGDLGISDQNYIDAPTKIEYIENVKEIKLCDMHSALITNSGELYVAGCGWDGSNNINQFTKIELTEKVNYIWKDYRGKCFAVFNDGSVKAWMCLAIDNGTQIDLYYDNANPIYETQYESLSNGSGFTAGINQQGELFYWGRDFLGGTERKSDYEMINEPCKILGLTNVQACYSGDGVIYAKTGLRIHIVKE